MELWKELLIRALQEEKTGFIIGETDICRLIETECYQALVKIRDILEDDNLEDAECFFRIEEIVCAIKELGGSVSFRHDFG